MHEIICPHCKKAFKVDEAGYADILKQVRDSDFDKQLHERLELAQKQKEHEVQLARSRAESEMQKAAAERDAQIQELRAQIQASEVHQKLAVSEAVSALTALGYKPQEASRLVRAVSTEGLRTEEIIRQALKSVAG